MKKNLVIFAILFLALAVRFLWLDRIDLTADELHYAGDAQRFYQGDPYIFFRRHPFRHPAPSIGHPFFFQIATAAFFKLFGVGVTIPRMVSAVAGIATTFLFLLVHKFSLKIRLFSAMFFAVSPFAVRFGRDGHLDSLFTLFIFGAAIFSWNFCQTNKRKWLILSGFCGALAFSTKLDGAIAIFLTLVPLFIFKKINKQVLILLAVSFLPLTLLLNDLSSYADGIFNPTDPAFAAMSKKFSLNFFSLVNFIYQVFSHLLPWPFLFLFILAFSVGLSRRKKQETFFFIIFLFLLPLFLLHQPGASGEYGWLPIAAFIYLFTALEIAKIAERVYLAIVAIIIFFSLPWTFSYGLRAVRANYYAADYPYNRIMNENFYIRVISYINQKTSRSAKILFLPQNGYPLFALRSDLSWSYFGGENEFDYCVVSSPKLVPKEMRKVKAAAIFEGRQDGENFKRYIYKKI